MSATPPPIEGKKSSARRRIGELLIEAGLISEEDLQACLNEAKKTGQFVGHVLIRQGKVSREQLGKALSVQYNTKYVSVSKLEIDPALLSLLPQDFMRHKQVLPIAKEGGRLVVAMVDPTNRSIIDEITFITGMRPHAVVTTNIEFQEAYTKHIGVGSSNTLIEEISASKEEEDALTQDSIQDTEGDANNPLVKLVNSILEEGIERGASDIHIEPRTKKYLVRFRVDGILNTILDVPQNMEASFVTRIKVMAKMDIAEHRRPQDGRIVMRYQGSEYNMRVNTLPTSGNREKIVIRILRPQKNISDFRGLGFSDGDIGKMQYLYKSPYGIILVCGPTGSGKTTTLYTVLHKINDDHRNISTVEDPVELSIEGLNQSQVNPKADYTFASSMRALLRQDPDVIMVGEIRDYETLEAAIHAALTGHLVFSTIHSNTTSATITRMIEMGAASNLISTALMGVIAQRLARRICQSCKGVYAATKEEKKVIFPDDESKLQEEILIAKGQGCDLCGKTGCAGRKGLYEIMVINREIRQLISSDCSDLEIEDAAVASGMRTLAMCGRDAILNHEISVDEAIRVLGENLGGS